jgi:hypothetical protein
MSADKPVDFCGFADIAISIIFVFVGETLEVSFFFVCRTPYITRHD